MWTDMGMPITVKCEKGRLAIYRAEDLAGEMVEKVAVGCNK